MLKTLSKTTQIFQCFTIIIHFVHSLQSNKFDVNETDLLKVRLPNFIHKALTNCIRIDAHFSNA